MNISNLIASDSILSAFDFETVYRILLRLSELGCVEFKQK